MEWLAQTDEYAVAAAAISVAVAAVPACLAGPAVQDIVAELLQQPASAAAELHFAGILALLIDVQKD